MGWVGVDYDGTLRFRDILGTSGKRGDPIAPMVERVKLMLREGKDVRIFTARVSKKPGRYAGLARHPEIERLDIELWCLLTFGRVLPVTNVKDYDCDEIWDDIAVSVELNTGEYFRFGEEIPGGDEKAA